MNSPVARSWTHTLANAGLCVYATITLNDVALIVTIVSGLASLALTLLTLRKTMDKKRGGDAD